MANNFIQASLFPEFDKENSMTAIKKKEKERWQKKKDSYFGLEYCSTAMFNGVFEIPFIKAYKGSLPKRFITLSEIDEKGNPSTGVCCCDYDYILDELCETPKSYLSTLSKYHSIVEPDLSAKIGTPYAVIIGNMFRSHSTSLCFQNNGIPVIPMMKWAMPNSYDVCFSGYEKGGAVFVSTVGALQDSRSRMYFKHGFNEMLKRISPDCVILYGDINDWVLSLMPEQLDVHHYPHERFERMRSYGQQRAV